MDLTFSDHINSLEPGEDPSRGFDTVWEKLRRGLRREIRRRGLWHLSPRYLGVEGEAIWNDQALGELATDCYIFAILDRLPSLKALLEVSGTVEGAVVSNIKHFVHGRQRKQDPVGYKIYDVTRCALERLIEEGTLAVLEGESGTIENETLFCYPPLAGSVDSQAGDLRDRVKDWRGELFTDMVIGIRNRRARAEEQLALAIADLSNSGVTGFRFKSLIDVVKARGRRHWGMLQEQELGEFAPEGESGAEAAAWVPLVPPKVLIEDREAYRKLLECMALELTRCRVRPRIREQLQALWELLKVHAAESDRDRPPPQRQMAAMLGIARGTLRKRQRRIRPMIEGCREGLGGRRERAT